MIPALLALGCCLGSMMADTGHPEPGVLALGDSYTVGEGVERGESWPLQLTALLNRQHGRALAPPRVIATTGWTTDELDEALARAQADETDPLAPCYRLVFLSVGVNDQYRGRSQERFVEGFAALLASAIDLAGGEPAGVVVVSIPDWSLTPFALSRGANRARIGAEIDRFNRAKKAATEAAGATFVDITGLTRQAGLSEYAADGLHPGPSIYRRWADTLLAAASAALDRPEACSSSR